MIIGLLDKKITIEKGVEGTTSGRSPKLVYEEYMVTSANVYVRAASSKFDESEELLYTTEFTVWYNSKSKQINNKYRIKYNDQYYKIIEIIETETRQAIKFITTRYGN